MPSARRRRGPDTDDLSFEDAPYQAKRGPRAAAFDTNADTDPPPEGDRWSTWDGAVHGPEPHPDWLVTDLAAVDTELGVLKTGKEADVHLVRRAVPGTDRECLLAAKRYRDGEHRLFHRDAGYLEGRRMRRSRENRAMAGRTAFGRQVIAGQWAAAEFGALARLFQINAEHAAATAQAGIDAPAPITVPYPVQLSGTEVMLEFIGDPETGQGAPRLAQLRPDPADLADLWTQLVDAMVVLARSGLAHGDLSAYNLLVHRGRLVLIDLPQIVDVVANPQGADFLARDVRNVSTWFTAHGLPPGAPWANRDALTALLREEAGLR
ncbi:serine protein kinase RIO [Rhizomonospora bruguierae]|uniref:serine protein kinase RIO n=1 Tax=Rhizomonospora bruguierae TaxID=1581705 RepID=UPI0020C01BAA|nr:RIO1 family regulatory kinase/ATPase [Micromonospora sp. NBRC 107566]